MAKKPKSGDLLPAQFSYTEIADTSDRSKLVSITAQCNRAIKTASQGFVELGHAISAGHDILAKHKSGSYGRWVNHELGISRQTAENYRRSYLLLKQRNILSNSLTISATAMYKIASPKTPQPVVDKVVADAKKSNQITEPTVKKYLDEWKQKNPDPPKEPQIDVEIDDEDDEDDPTIEGQIEEWNRSIESFCRRLTDLMAEAPDGPWVADRDRIGTAVAQVKSAATTLRQAKCAHVCPECDGDGCDVCKDTGMLPKGVFDQL